MFCQDCQLDICYAKVVAMKKFVVVLSIAAYLSLSNFCLIRAAITGESHHVHSVATECLLGRHHHGPDGDHEAAQSPSHHHKSSDSDPCCTKLQDDPALLPSVPAFIKSAFVAATLLAPLLNAPLSSGQSISVRGDRGPPGSSISQLFFSPRGSRAPPLPVGL